MRWLCECIEMIKLMIKESFRYWNKRIKKELKFMSIHSTHTRTTHWFCLIENNFMWRRKPVGQLILSSRNKYGLDLKIFTGQHESNVSSPNYLKIRNKKKELTNAYKTHVVLIKLEYENKWNGERTVCACIFCERQNDSLKHIIQHSAHIFNLTFTLSLLNNIILIRLIFFYTFISSTI